MRLGIIAPDCPPALGGMERVAEHLSAALAVGHDVQLFTLPDRGLPAARFPLSPQLRGNPEADAALLNAAGVDAWLSLNAGYTMAADRLAAPFFTFFNGNDFLAPWYGPDFWMARALKDMPYLWRYTEAVSHWDRRRRIRAALPSVRCVFPLSRSTAALAEKRLGVPPARMRIIPPGVDDIFFGVDRQESAGPLRILTVCRLTNPRKNVDGVLQAIAQVHSDLPCEYTVVGDGLDRPRLEALARELKIADRVKFLGAVSQQQLLDAYRQSDLFILAARASKTDVEGFGIVYLEASAAGVPAMCSAAGGATDAIADGTNGILIETSTPEAIAAGIRRFAAERQRFTLAAVRGFAEKFRWQAIARQVSDEIHSRLASNVPSPSGRGLG